MRVKWTVGRIFLSVVTVMFLGAGTCGLWAGWQWQQKLESCRADKVMEGPMDLSAPGEFEFRYQQNSQIPHSAMIWLRLPEEFLAKNDPEVFLEPLKATVSVTGDKGVFRDLGEVSTIHINRVRRWEGMIPLFHLPLVGKGTGKVKVVIHQGVPLLQGLPQHLEGRYQLCGCEGIPIYIFNGFGGFSTLIGGLLALVFYRSIEKDKKRSDCSRLDMPYQPTISP